MLITLYAICLLFYMPFHDIAPTLCHYYAAAAIIYFLLTAIDTFIIMLIAFRRAIFYCRHFSLLTFDTLLHDIYYIFFSYGAYDADATVIVFSMMFAFAAPP